MRTLLVSLAALVLAVGCTTRPMVTEEHSNELETAVQAISQADTGQVRRYAPVDLRRAGDALADARAAADSGDGPRAAHLAHLARRHAEIAVAKAEAAAASTRATELAQQREQLRLETRNQQLSQQERQIQTLREQLAELSPRQTDRGLVLTLGNVLFAFDSARLNASAQDPLDKLAAFLRESPDRQVRIEGHTDSTGPAEYNQQLSRQRAQSVADAMVDRGISGARMTVVGYGESRPVASNDTETGRQQNRRVEFLILD